MLDQQRRGRFVFRVSAVEEETRFSSSGPPYRMTAASSNAMIHRATPTRVLSPPPLPPPTREFSAKRRSADSDRCVLLPRAELGSQIARSAVARTSPLWRVSSLDRGEPVGKRACDVAWQDTHARTHARTQAGRHARMHAYARTVERLEAADVKTPNGNRSC